MRLISDISAFTIIWIFLSIPMEIDCKDVGIYVYVFVSLRYILKSNVTL